MVLQRSSGCRTGRRWRRFASDARWKYACGGLDFDYPGFSHTMLVDIRERLRCSQAPNRIRDVSIEAAREAGLVRQRRVLDSTPLYDAVATVDTNHLVRSAIRGFLKVADEDLEAELRSSRPSSAKAAWTPG